MSHWFEHTASPGLNSVWGGGQLQGLTYVSKHSPTIFHPRPQDNSVRVSNIFPVYLLALFHLLLGLRIA